MAKQPTQSRTDDPATAPVEPKARGRTRAAKNPGPDPLTTANPPGEEEIRMRAYVRYLERGGDHGADFDDWVRAEEDLKKTKK